MHCDVVTTYIGFVASFAVFLLAVDKQRRII
ncbi:ATP-dependent Clp protease proteolytic subunit [Clostridium botulinum]|nr:ATP-dependent Clp protease proteolytic subunit [Clostridium botulinum]NFR20823.1 ATP-dependent Clp protease proteolytic subunit [Clostridium botulinum]